MDLRISKTITDVEQFCNKSPKAWNITPEQGKLLYLLVHLHKPKHILEVGMSYGYSTLWLGAAAQEIGAAVTTIDIDPEKVKIAKQHFQQAGLLGIIAIKQGDANSIVESIAKKRNKEMVDFLFLDAGKNDYLFQFKTLLPIMSKGSVCVADNAITHAKQMADFLDFVRTSKEVDSVLLDVGHGMELIVKK